MQKRRNYVRMISFIMAFALMLTSAGIPSVTVEAAKNVKVRKVQITSPKKASITLNKGESLKLKVKVTPKNAKNSKVTYKSSDKKIVKVTSKGKITGLRNGKAKITVTAKDGSRKKDTIKVKVVTPVSKGKTDIPDASTDAGKKNSRKDCRRDSSGRREPEGCVCYFDNTEYHKYGCQAQKDRDYNDSG